MPHPPPFDSPSPLRSADVDDLARLLQPDRPPEVRRAALAALVHLPLEADAWTALAAMFLRWLPADPDGEPADDAPTPLAELIELAARVPVREVRERLRRLLERRDATIRRAVAHVLARAGDEIAGKRLGADLRHADGEIRFEAAQSLFRMERPAARAHLKRCTKKDPRLDVRLLAALALAKAGDGKPLLRLLRSRASDHLSPGHLAAGWWVSEVARMASLPAKVQDSLRHLPAEALGGERGRIVRALCEECAASASAPAAGIPEPPPEPDPAARERARASLTAILARPEREIAESDIDGPALRALPAEEAGALALHLARAVVHAIESGRQDVAPGNVLVSVLGHVPPGWRVPVEPLFESWKRLDRADVRAQLGWVMSLGGLRHLVLGLRPALASAETSLCLAGCEAIATAARTARTGPPVFGAGGSGAGPDLPLTGKLLSLASAPGDADRATTGTVPVPPGARGRAVWSAARGLIALPRTLLSRPARRMIVLPGRPGLGADSVTLSMSEPRTLTQRLREMYGRLSVGAGRESARSQKSFAADRTVSTGFSRAWWPTRPIAARQPLAPGRRYCFWLEIGRPVKGSIERAPVALPEMAAGTRLRVVLFGFEGGIDLLDRPPTGELELVAAGQAIVVPQPGDRRGRLLWRRVWRHRLFFLVAMPARAGRHRLRCNIYHGQTLLQSRVVEAEAASISARIGAALRRLARRAPVRLASTVDYTLTQRFDPEHIESLGPHQLSVLLNDNGDGTHALRLLGEDGVPRNVTLDRGDLTLLVDVPRRALRHISWGSEEPWDPAGGRTFLYEHGGCDLRRLARDLARLAVAGSQAYFTISGRLDDEGGRSLLARLTRRPARLQIALKERAHTAFPAALLYDIPFDTNAFPLEGTDFELCPTFVQALKDGTPLAECACFRGECAFRREVEEHLERAGGLLKDLGPRVCPGGFWGFRHEIGLPLSLKEAEEAFAGQTCTGAPAVTVGAALTLLGWPAHCERVPQFGAAKSCCVATSRDDVLRKLKQSRPHLVYFYCHGGVDRNRRPFLDLDRQGELGITPDNLFANRIRWSGPRPLVFLNGCHTTAVEDDVALEFVSGFVQRIGAGGVIGTEITIFEPLACGFAEAFLPRFFAGEAVGRAVREARLALLAEGNPLGLVYTPYVVPAFQLARN